MKLFKKELYIIGNRPQTDWRRIFTTAMVLAIGISVYGVVFYRDISFKSKDVETPVVIGEAVSNQPVSKDSKLELNQVIELYLQKKERFEKLVSELKNS